jgi:hypothetical protein
MLLAAPSYAIDSQYMPALKTTGKALYIQTGAREWVNERKRWAKERGPWFLYPLIWYGETYMDKRFEFQLKIKEIRGQINLNGKVDNYGLPKTEGEIRYVLHFFSFPLIE